MALAKDIFKNPFKPGAGHSPPYLAGRLAELQEFQKLLGQEIILENLILTGLRGVGKTVLLESLKPTAMRSQWLWVGTDLSESASISEEKLALRVLTDLSVVTSAWRLPTSHTPGVGFASQTRSEELTLNFYTLKHHYDTTPGLPADKLKATLEMVASLLPHLTFKGIVFAYDEAQNLFDFAEEKEYALSMLLDVFQSLQRKQIPFMLAFAGLPTLFPNLVEARTYSERMFRVLTLDRLTPEECKDAILKPIEDSQCPVKFNQQSVTTITQISGGYPYFIQFICKEVYDVFIQQLQSKVPPSVPVDAITHKLDSDFFAGRWSKASDRQKDLLIVAAIVTNGGEGAFSVQDLVQHSKNIPNLKAFGGSYANQTLSALMKIGLIYKNRHGKYSFAVPLLGQYVLRQHT